MKTTLTVIEVKQGDKVKYVGTYVRGQKIQLVNDIEDAGNFTNKEDLIQPAVTSLRLPGAKYYAFSAPSVDSAEVVVIEVVRTEVMRRSAIPVA